MFQSCVSHRNRKRLLVLMLAPMLILMAQGQVYGQVEESTASKRALTMDDFDSWLSLGNSAISPNGQWVLYTEKPREGDTVLFVRHANRNTKYVFDDGNATGPRFTYDSQFVAFIINPTTEQEEKAKEAGDDPPARKMGLMDLSDGSVEIVEWVTNFSLPEKSGEWIAYKKQITIKPEKEAEEKEEQEEAKEGEEGEEEGEKQEEQKKEEAEPEYQTVMVLRNLLDGSETEYEDVDNFRFGVNGKTFYFAVPKKEEKEEGEEGGESVARAGRGRGRQAGQRVGQRGGQQRGQRAGQQRGQRQRGQRGGRGGGQAGGNNEQDDSYKLVFRSLEDDYEKEFENVSNYRLFKKEESMLYIVSDKDHPENNGVYHYNIVDDSVDAMVTGKGKYTGWQLNRDETILAFLTDRDDQKEEVEEEEAQEEEEEEEQEKEAEETEDEEDEVQPLMSIYGGEIASGRASLWVSPMETGNFPENMQLAGQRFSFSFDSRLITFNITERPKPKEEEEEEEGDEKEKEEEGPKAVFDLWHWDDPYPYPQLKRRPNPVSKNRTAVYHIRRDRFVQLGDDELPQVSLTNDSDIAIGHNNLPYIKVASYDTSYNDIWVVNTRTGDRTLVGKRMRGSARPSPAGKYLTWFRGEDWFVYSIADRTVTNITENLDSVFVNEMHDTPSAPGGYGIAGWTEDDATILLYDRCDIWEVKPNGADARIITEGFGKKNGLAFRLQNMRQTEPDEFVDTRFIDTAEPLLLGTTNEQTRAKGYYRDQYAGEELPQKLIMIDRNLGRPTKAKSANRFMLTRPTFEEYPDLWVCDSNFQGMRKISNTGRQLNKYLWGSSELRHFSSSDGKPLMGILYLPENFDLDKKYPLMVYIYETLHTGRHSFTNPGPGTSINTSFYVSNGYVLWKPDIEYDIGYPGQDALKCVLPGIQMLIREGFIDPDAIGIQGHSWGGYQIAYMITQTNIFAAVEAGAPVTNMTSAYGGIRWSSGMVRQFQYERTQSRIGASLWEKPLRYLENSPLFWADKVQTPLLMLHNDEDGAVPWYQGIEFMMAMRRLEKEAYMFNYNGEAHGLRKRENQIDFTIRMKEFFDHHLKGAPMPDWMKNGVRKFRDN